MFGVLLIIFQIFAVQFSNGIPSLSSLHKFGNFLLINRSPLSGMPLSYYFPPNFWRDVGSNHSEESAIDERILATYGLNIYDGACWQIGVTLTNPSLFEKEVVKHAEILLSGKNGEFGLRANDYSMFTYGINGPHKNYTGDFPFFYRAISDSIEHTDPLTNKNVSWMDWLPVLGENAWATLLGPLASYAYQSRSSNDTPISYDHPLIQIAVKSLDVYLAMQSDIGAVFYAPKGTYGTTASRISSENNVSLYSGLRILRALLKRLGDPEGRLKDIDILLIGIERFFREYAFDTKNGVFYQGGTISSNGSFIPNTVFPVDVQTWGLSVFGKMTDEWGYQGLSFQIWKNTRIRSGVFDNDNNLLGVGYTDSDDIISIEWTLGAINMCRILAEQYRITDPEKASLLLKDSASMRTGIENYIMGDDIWTAFLYASKRYFVPFGWFANPVPSLTSTSWAIMVDSNFNPFHESGTYAQEESIQNVLAEIQ